MALVPVRTETAWWRTLRTASDLGLFWSSPTFGSRIQFVNPSTGRVRNQNNIASTVFYHGPYPDRFLSAFKAHGDPFLGGSWHEFEPGIVQALFERKNTNKKP